MTVHPPKVVFITGSSVGFGHALVEETLTAGNSVVATLRTPAVLDDLRELHSTDRLLILPLDVTFQGINREPFFEAKKAFGSVDVVVNNAGSGIIAEVEGTPEDVGGKVFDVNFWGSLEVSK